MTQSAAPRPIFRRWLILAGAVGLALILAVLGLVFGVFQADSTGALNVSFVRFEKSEDGTDNLAVLLVTNQTQKDYSVFLDGETRWAFCKIVPRCPTGSVADKTPSAANAITWALPGCFEFEYTVRLPEDGQQGHMALWCERLPQKLPRLLNEARKLMWNVYDPPRKPVWAVSDEEIQCPKRLPDGTVEPPRLLPAAERPR